jgi:hypothetical protein
VKGACRILLCVFAGLYALALALFGIGTFGLFGSKSGPLAGVYLVPLGLPWNRMLHGFPDAALPWLAATSPLVNLCIVYAVCQLIGKR